MRDPNTDHSLRNLQSGIDLELTHSCIAHDLEAAAFRLTPAGAEAAPAKEDLRQTFNRELGAEVSWIAENIPGGDEFYAALDRIVAIAARYDNFNRLQEWRLVQERRQKYVAWAALCSAAIGAALLASGQW